jgi:hypothetical protein
MESSDAGMTFQQRASHSKDFGQPVSGLKTDSHEALDCGKFLCTGCRRGV